jgi:prevent-host-death family protein
MDADVQFGYTVRIERFKRESKIMDTLSANEAKTQFGDLLLKAQRAPVQINKNGKPVAVVISFDDYESLEALKLQTLHARAAQAKAAIAAGNTVEGDAFFEALESGRYD